MLPYIRRGLNRSRPQGNDLRAAVRGEQDRVGGSRERQFPSVVPTNRERGTDVLDVLQAFNGIGVVAREPAEARPDRSDDAGRQRPVHTSDGEARLRRPRIAKNQRIARLNQYAMRHRPSPPVPPVQTTGPPSSTGTAV